MRYTIGRVITIDDLPDDALLEIFDFYVERYHILVFRGFDICDIKREIELWQTLVHVCRRWRDLVFVSPRRLNLQLCCTTRRPARMALDVWPALPPIDLVIYGESSNETADNVIDALGHRDRICQIDLNCESNLQTIWTALQVPFPELTVLYLRNLTYPWPAPNLPDSFLGGSAPRLRYLALTSIPFPELPKLLLSTAHLVYLLLVDMPMIGYLSPETMATSLSMLTSLESLQLEFALSRWSCPDLKHRRPFSPTRFVLPALEIFLFKGENEYLEELLAKIDAPQLYHLSTSFFDKINFDTSELIQFISRTPMIGAYNEARLIFRIREALVRLESHPAPFYHLVEVTILTNESDRQLSFLAQICTLSLGLLLTNLTMENLYIHELGPLAFDWHGDIENTEWLDLLLPFTAVKNLYLSKRFSRNITHTLQERTGGITTEVLPALQNIFLEGFQSSEDSEPVQEGIAQSISSRRLTNHPVVISVWHRDLAREWVRPSVPL